MLRLCYLRLSSTTWGADQSPSLASAPWRTRRSLFKSLVHSIYLFSKFTDSKHFATKIRQLLATILQVICRSWRLFFLRHQTSYYTKFSLKSSPSHLCSNFLSLQRCRKKLHAHHTRSKYAGSTNYYHRSASPNFLHYVFSLYLFRLDIYL